MAVNGSVGRADWPQGWGDGCDRGAQGQTRGQPGDEVMTALMAGRRQAPQAFPRALAPLRLVPARHFPRDHRGAQRPLRAVVRRLRRRVVQATQHHPTTLHDPRLDRPVAWLRSLLLQQPVQPQLQMPTLTRKLLFSESRTVTPQRADHREHQLPLVQVARVRRVRTIPCLGDRLLVVRDAFVRRIRHAFVAGQAVAHQDPGERCVQRVQHHLPAPARVHVVDRGVDRRERPEPSTGSSHIPTRLVDEHSRRRMDLEDQLIEARLDPLGGALRRLGQPAGAERQAGHLLEHPAGLPHREAEVLVQADRQGAGPRAELDLGRAGGVGGLQGMSALDVAARRRSGRGR
jgi:hypothetical protein